MFLCLPDPDPLVRGIDPDPNPSVIIRKTLIPPVFLLLLDFLSLKNYINVPSKSNKKKNFFLISFLLTKIAESGSIIQRHGSADSDLDPDPHQNVMDPEH
jgi:hypothetical protein